MGHLLLGVEILVVRKKDPHTLSIAGALRIVREAMASQVHLRGKENWQDRFGRAVKDGYRRKASKQARDWPHKKHDPRPGVPHIQMVTEEERLEAQRIYDAA